MGIKKRWIAFFLVGILGITVLLYASDTRLIDLHVKSGEYEEAIRLYENVLFTQPQNARLHYELANVFLLADRSNEALEYLHKAYALGDNSDRLLRQLYSAYQKNENRNGMITMLETLVKRHPKDRNQRAQLAALYAWADQPDAAITHYRYLLEHEPDNAEFVYKLSSLYQADQSYAKAAVVLENYRTYAPSDEKASHLLADVYLADGRWKKAAAYYEQFVRDNPADIALRDRLVEIYKWKKKAPRALPHLHYLADAEFASRATYRNQFLALSRQYEPLHAVYYLENRLKMEPENTDVHRELADLFIFLGRPSSALFHMKKQLEHAPDNAALHKKLAVLLQTIDEPGEALIAYRAAFEKGDTSRTTIDFLLQEYSFQKKFDQYLTLQERMLSRHIARTLDRKNRATMLFKTGELSAAIDEFIDVLQIQPQDAVTRQQLAYALIAADKNAQAAAVLWQGVEAYQVEDENYLQTCIRQFVRENQPERSLHCYRLLSRKFPGNLDYQFGYRNELVRNGLYHQALAEFEKQDKKRSLTTSERLQIAMLYWRLGEKKKMRAALPKKMKTLAEQKQLVQFYFESAMFDEAISAARPLLKTMPHDSVLLRTLGMSYAWNNRPSMATKILEKYHQGYEGDYESRFHLGEIYLAGEKQREARTEFRTAMRMLKSEAENKNKKLVQARILARQKKMRASRQIYEKLLRESPDDVFVQLDYIASLIDVSQFSQAQTRLALFRKKHPANNQAIQLQSALHFKNGEPAKALQAMNQLEKNGVLNSGQLLDMADLHLMLGDWVSAENKLQAALAVDPQNEAARARLFRLRRDNGAAVSTGYAVGQQSSRFQRKMYSVLCSFAKSSLGQFFFRADKIQPTDTRRPEKQAEYSSVSAGVRSRLNEQLELRSTAALNQHGANQGVTASAVTRWYFHPGNALALRLFYNQIWRDIYFAECLGGRQKGIEVTVGFNPIAHWRLHAGYAHFTNSLTLPNLEMGTLNRMHVQTDYAFNALRNVLFSYDFYRFDYSGIGGRHELNQFLHDEMVHNLGLRYSYDGSRFFLNLGGSLGYQAARDEMIYYTDFNVDYMLLRNVRLRSQLSYGTERQALVQGDSYNILFDLGYFY